MKNQRLAWFLIGNLIGLGGLLFVVLVSDASRRSAPDASQVHPGTEAPVQTPGAKTKPASLTDKAEDSAGG